MTNQTQPKLWPLAIFVVLYMALSIGASLMAGNTEFVFYIIVMVVLIAVVLLVHFRVGLTSWLLWLLAVWGLLHMAGGLVPLPKGWPYDGENAVLYSWWLVPDRLKYDQVVHAYGFGLTTWVCWHVLKTCLRDLQGRVPKPTFGLLVLCVAAGCGFGAINEVVEFAATLMMPKTNVGGYENTGWDLVANLVGGIVAAVGVRLTSK
ncbi:DUF2238 domain-containing protein [Phragmitibacter flavus]|uniref:DUF2238 domain-containing protein n=1 Tax=Phragmitibacter flavus TaxID=2576071 RepID=A0A5R8K804_9BACT|nr:DUF2238 domain-containing protein [Phragmitibacter flavus]TLD68456.1 DUF2238 domain-containing protein [Phragmitibacter flavus]